MPARTPQCALTTMQKLAWSYLDQASRGDFGRSSVVLSKFALTYPGVRAQLATATGVAALPPRIDEFFSELTAATLGFVLSAAAVDADGNVANPALREAALQIRTRTAANVGELFSTRIAPVVPWNAPIRAFVDLTKGTEVDRLGTALDGAIAEGFECSSASSFDDLISSLAQPSAPSASSRSTAAVELPGFTIRARSGAPAIPRWVYFGGAAVAVGVAGWAIWEAAR